MHHLDNQQFPQGMQYFPGFSVGQLWRGISVELCLALGHLLIIYYTSLHKYHGRSQIFHCSFQDFFSVGVTYSIKLIFMETGPLF